MPEKCEKLGCNDEAVGKLQFTDQFDQVTSENAVPLCETHVWELQRFKNHDVAGVQLWLKTVE